MILKLKKGTGVKAFMNKDILYVDMKQIKLDRVLTNLFIKMYANGAPVTMAFRKEYTIDVLKNNLSQLEMMVLSKALMIILMVWRIG